MFLDDVQRALVRLPLEQREALLLVTQQGETYADVAARCGVAEGTIKSRVKPARSQLAAMLQMENRHDLRPGSADASRPPALERRSFHVKPSLAPPGV